MDEGEQGASGEQDGCDLPFPLEHMTVAGRKGSSCFAVKCNICGWSGTATLHKLIYGHFLSLPKMDVVPCVKPDRLRANYPAFWEQLDARHKTWVAKKRCDVAD